VDVGTISTTNKDLEQETRRGNFREDLFYRLNVIEVVLPPLRDRSEDILALVEHFLAEACKRTGKRLRGLTEAASKILLQYPWPGNVRELENVIERAVALAERELVDIDDLPPQVRERRSADVLQGALSRALTLDELEREYIHRVLQAEGGNKTRAAQRLGLDRKTLYRKLDEYTRPAAEPRGAEPAEPGATPPSGAIAITEPPAVERRATPPATVADEGPSRIEATVPIMRVDPSEEG